MTAKGGRRKIKIILRHPIRLKLKGKSIQPYPSEKTKDSLQKKAIVEEQWDLISFRIAK